jgi:DNA invertase Pin-like site-specific DNA recombinase
VRIGSEKSKPKIIALYGRVSVLDEDVTHGSLEQQENICRDLLRHLEISTGYKMEVRHVLIEERGISGATQNRPKFQTLRRLIITGQIDGVCAKEISRLSRSTKDFIEFMDLCGHHGVAIYIPGLNMDPSDPLGSLVFNPIARIRI